MYPKVDGIIQSPTTPVVGQRLWACTLLSYKHYFKYGSTIHLTKVLEIEGPDANGVSFLKTWGSVYMLVPSAKPNDFPNIPR